MADARTEFHREVQALADTLTEHVNAWIADHQGYDPASRVAVIASAYCGLYLKLMEYAGGHPGQGWERLPIFAALRPKEVS